MGSYGVPLFGLPIPWPPPYVLWTLMAAAIALPFVLPPRRRHWPLAVLPALSFCLAGAGSGPAGILVVILIIAPARPLLAPGRPWRRRAA